MEGSEENPQAIGCPCPVDEIIAKTEYLNAKVEQKINKTQTLMYTNNLSKDLNESLIKNSLQDRIIDITSWHWVLQDLSKRLSESQKALEYELKAIKVVCQRIKDEILGHLKKGGRIDYIMCPAWDDVEVFIKKEINQLREKKKSFESLTSIVESKIASMDNIRAKIDKDILMKRETLSVEENVQACPCESVNPENLNGKKKKYSSLKEWEKRCLSLKNEGLKALSTGLIIKQQARGARAQLTIETQSTANKVDAALRKRLHVNKLKIQELEWQKEAILRDLRSLDEEKLNTEQTLIANMEQERVLQVRLKDRDQRPAGELIRDEVNSNMKGELGRVRCFINELRNNLEGILTLQKHLTSLMQKTECVLVDLDKVYEIDKQRAETRFGFIEPVDRRSNCLDNQENPTGLITIQEEAEDDYPFAD